MRSFRYAVAVAALFALTLAGCGPRPDPGTTCDPCESDSGVIADEDAGKTGTDAGEDAGSNAADGGDDAGTVTDAGFDAGTAPSITSVQIGPITIYTDTVATATPLGWNDPDGDPERYRFTWLVNNAPVASDGGSTLPGDFFVRNDFVSVIVTPFDELHDGAAVTSPTLVVSNTPPLAAAVVLSPTDATTTSTLTCTPYTADKDGDTLTHSYAWTVNSAAIAPTTATLAGTYFVKGDSVVCTATAFDGTNNGAPLSSSPLVIANTPPTLTSVSLTPATLYTDTNVTATPSGATDVDGDVITYSYRWTVNGTVVASATTSTLSATFFSKGQTVSAEMTPNDGQPGAPVSSATTTVQNSLPTAPVLSITPVSAQPGQALQCVIATSSTDADGDALTYSYLWTKNGAATVYTTSTVPANVTNHGESWQCVVSPSDGTGTGSAGNASRLVQDTVAPSAPTLNATERYRNENTVVLGGAAEPNSTVRITRTCGGPPTTYTTTANGTGVFSLTITMTGGTVCSFSATATDAAGNVSGSSTSLTTEVCSPPDTYEDPFTTGDVCSDSIDAWPVLTAAPATQFSVHGNIPNSTDADWYRVATSQQVVGGTPVYHFEAQLTSGSSEYGLRICPSTCANPCFNPGSSYSTTSYSSPGTFYIRVVRLGTTLSCGGYDLLVKNGP